MHRTPLQNRVFPNGSIRAEPARGTMMGNRGGKFHDPDSKRLHPTKRWVSQQWLCCEAQFNDRQRSVMGHGYTELFFIDEVTALAAGHRPCFECRRADFLDFAERWRRAKRRKKRPTAKQMDEVLHRERLHGDDKRVDRAFWDDLPNATMIAWRGGAVAKHGGKPLLWSPDGYEAADPSDFEGQLVTVLTPPAIRTVLKTGYKPRWHPSAQSGPAD